MENYLLYPLLIGAGILAGFINTLAGSGSAISMLALSLAGLPVNIANATNRVAMFSQTLAGEYGFYKQGKLDWRYAKKLILPSILGSVAGTFAAIALNPENLGKIIGVLMVFVFISLFIKPDKWLRKEQKINYAFGAKRFAIWFAIGFYGGFIQIGVGIFMLLVLVLLEKIDLVRAEAIKAVAAFCFTATSLAIFCIKGQIVWTLGIILACGGIIGAWAATHEAVKRGAPFIRKIMIVVVAFCALYYLGIIHYIINKL